MEVLLSLGAIAVALFAVGKISDVMEMRSRERARRKTILDLAMLRTGLLRPEDVAGPAHAIAVGKLSAEAASLLRVLGATKYLVYAAEHSEWDEVNKVIEEAFPGFYADVPAEVDAAIDAAISAQLQRPRQPSTNR